MFNCKEIKIFKEIFIKSLKDKKILYETILFFLILVSGVVVNISLPFFFKRIVDNLYEHSFSFIWFVFLGYGILWIFSQSSMHLREFFRSRFEIHFISCFTEEILGKIFGLPFKSFHQKKTGELISILQQIQTSLPIVLVVIFSLIIPLISELVIVSFIIFKNYPLFYNVILLFTIIVFFVYTLFTHKILEKLAIKSINIDKLIKNKIFEFILNYETIKIFSLEKTVSKNYEKLLQGHEMTVCQARRTASLIRLCQVLILGSGFLVLTGFLIQGVKEGRLAAGDFILFHSYLLQFIMPVTIVGYNINDFKKASVELRDAINILLAPQEEINKATALSLKAERKGFQIEVQDVSFSYEGKEILKNISFKIEPKEKVVIVGPTGAGKSTLAQLFLNLHAPTKGKILMNGHNIQEIKHSSLRQNIGYVPQDIQLINGSLKDNLVFTSSEKTPAQVEKAIQKACLEDFCKKAENESEEIMLGERGVKLSKGEKQRIGIARIFLRNPVLCILDEPYSSLDIETSLRIHQNIMDYFVDKTLITITHRLLDVMKAQKIIYLNRGKIIKIGTHQELSKIKGYQKLFGLPHARKNTSVQ